MRASLCVLVVVLSLMMAGQGVAAPLERSVTYVGATPTGAAITLGGTGIAGATFFANAASPTLVSVADASGLPVAFVVGADANHDGVVDERVGEASLDACGEAVLDARFAASADLVVFVLTSPRCGGTATSGTIRVTY